jgi:hypothetical protein
VKYEVHLDSPVEYPGEDSERDGHEVRENEDVW